MGRLGLTFFGISLVELVFSIIFNTAIVMNLNGDNYTVGEVILASGFMDIHALLIDIIIISTIIIFLTLGLILYLVSKKKALGEFTLAKFLLLIGLFLIIGAFFKMTFLVFLGKSEINTGTLPLFFHDAMFSQSITPLLGLVIWMSFIGIVCCFLIFGLIFGAVGLKWSLSLQEKMGDNK